MRWRSVGCSQCDGCRVQRRRKVLLKAVFNTDERRDFVAQPMLIELEQQIDIEEQLPKEVRFHPDGTAHRVERVAREYDIWKDRLTIERLELHWPEALGLD